MSTISTHVLDTSRGRPAEGIAVTLEREGTIIGSGVTDRDGRIKDLLRSGHKLTAGVHSLAFAVGDYFAGNETSSFYDRIVISFQIDSDDEHYHVPLLLSPFGYSTYRGS